MLKMSEAKYLSFTWSSDCAEKLDEHSFQTSKTFSGDRGQPQSVA